MNSPFDLTGRVAVVTGANTGIGQGIALALAQAGADIAAVGRSEATETADKVRALGRKCELVSADLSSIASVKDVVESVVSSLGSLDILVNNAGIIRREDALDFSEEDWDAGGGGGGLWTNGDNAVHNNVIARNSSGYNGGGAFLQRVDADVVGNTIEDNTCGKDGAGIYFSVSSGTVSGNTIRGNQASDDAGGLRMFYGQTSILDNVFEGNSAGDDGGGAKVSHSEHTFAGNTFTDNVAGDAGGGLELDNDSSHVEDCTFEGNRARRGAGLHNWRTETRFTIEDSEFRGNEASDCGGAMSFDNSPYRISLRRLVFEGNTAVDGAAICTDLVYRDPDEVGGQENYYQDTVLDLASLLFIDNAASDDGGALYFKAGVVDIRNITIDGGGGYGAIAVKGSPVTMTSSIISDFDGYGMIVEDSDPSGVGTLDVSYSDIWDTDGVNGMSNPVGSDGNISENPDYTGDLELSSGSPCIDAGDPSGPSDADGSRADMGAYGGPDAW